MICFISRNILNQARYGSSFGRQLSISHFLPFRVTWRLTWDFARAGKLAAVDKKWVEIVFEAPEVSLGSFKMQYGGNSTVKLAILYLDDVVRIGRGSRGSLFIFKRRTWASFVWILRLSLILIVYTRLLQSISSVCSLSFHDRNDGCDMLTTDISHPKLLTSEYHRIPTMAWTKTMGCWCLFFQEPSVPSIIMFDY